MHMMVVSQLDTAAAPAILVIEDERDIAELLRIHLEDAGFKVVVANDGVAGLALARKTRWALLVLDLNLPGMDGLAICAALRQHTSYIPILMLTARGAEADRVLGLNSGADDYLPKPFSVIELVARAKAIIRRPVAASVHAADCLQIGPWRLDPQRREVQCNDTRLELTAREFDLLMYFFKNPGRVFSRAQLLDRVWGLTSDAYEHTVSSHINRLRSKIEPDPAKPRYLRTVWGVGYRFEVQDAT
jgi:DNA-binding response OmpR family regulator